MGRKDCGAGTPARRDPETKGALSTPLTTRHNFKILRIWRGRTKRAKADEYAPYLYETGIKPLEEKALGVQLFREDRETESEFITISYSGRAWKRCRASPAASPLGIPSP